jgi:hypothetical protein
MNLEEATKRITLEYIKTGCKGYQRLLKYINGNMKGNLDLDYTKVSYLPDGLKVGGFLDLNYTPITTLPKNLVVGQSLYLNNTPITSLPEDLKVFDNINLCNTLITTLPKNLKIGGWLALKNTPIRNNHTTLELRKMLKHMAYYLYL